jgi:hypothetical protein
VCVPAIEIGLCGLDRLEALAVQRRLLRVANAGFTLACSREAVRLRQRGACVDTCRPRPAHHRPVAVIDLALFTGRRGDHDPRLVDDRPTELRDELFDAGALSGEAVIIDEVLIHRDRVATAADRLGNSARDTAHRR